MKCVQKVKKEQEYKDCFQKILKKDQGKDEDEDKCATCICKQLRLNMRLDPKDYPILKEMFCFSGK